MSLGFIEAFEPAPDAILEMMAPGVSDLMLRQIAALDYRMNFDEHLDALKRMRDEKQFPSPLRIVPSEVMALAMCGGGKLPNYTKDQRDMTSDETHHAMEFLSVCWVWCIAIDNPKDPWLDDFRLLAPLNCLMRSVADAEMEKTVAVARLLAWAVDRLQKWDHEQEVFLGVGLLAVTLGVAGGPRLAVNEDAIRGLVDHIRLEEQPDEEFGEYYRYGNAPGPYFRQYFYDPMWGVVGQRLKNAEFADLSEGLQKSITELGDLLERGAAFCEVAR